MPNIPIYSQRTDVGGITPYGQASAAMAPTDTSDAQAMAGLANAAGAAAGYYKKREEEEAVFQARKAATDAIPQWKQYIEDQKKNIPTDGSAQEYISGMTDRAQQDFKKWSDSQIEAMPTKRSKQELELSLGNIRNSLVDQTIQYQAKETAQLKLAGLQSTFDTNESTVFAHPQMADGLIAHESAMIDSMTGVDPSKLAMLRQQRKEKLVDLSLGGSVQAFQNDAMTVPIDEIKKFRDTLTEEKGGWVGHASPQAIEHAQDQLTKLLTTRETAQQKIGLDAIQERVRERSAGNSNGLSLAEADFIQDPDLKLKAQKMITTANLMGDAVQVTAGASMPDIVKMFQADTERLKTSGNYDQDLAVLNARKAAFEQRIQQENADPAGYAMKVNPTVANAYTQMAANPSPATIKSYVSLLSAEQQRLNPGRIPTLLPTQQADALVTDINQRIMTGQGAGEVLQSEAQKWGEYWPSIYGQISKNLPPDAYTIGAGMRGADANFLGNLSKFKTEDLKKGIDNSRLTGFDSTISTKFAPFIQTLASQPGGQDAIGKIMTSSEKMVYGYMAQEPGLSLRDAVDRAYTATVGHKYSIEGNARIPTTFNGTPVDSSRVMKGSQAVIDHLDQVPLAIPKDPSLKPGAEKQDYINRVKNNGVFLTNPDESGLALYVKDNAGVYSVVRSNTGQPIEYSWASLTDKSAAHKGWNFFAPIKKLESVDLIPDAHPAPIMAPTPAAAKQSVKDEKAAMPGKFPAVSPDEQKSRDATAKQLMLRELDSAKTPAEKAAIQREMKARGF